MDPPADGKVGKLGLTRKAKVKASKQVKLNLTVSNSGGKALTAKVIIKSSSRQVKVPKSVTLKVAPGKTLSKKITVKAGKKAKGKATITAKAGGRTAKSKITVKRR